MSGIQEEQMQERSVGFYDLVPLPDFTELKYEPVTRYSRVPTFKFETHKSKYGDHEKYAGADFPVAVLKDVQALMKRHGWRLTNRAKMLGANDRLFIWKKDSSGEIGTAKAIVEIRTYTRQGFRFAAIRIENECV